LERVWPATAGFDVTPTKNFILPNLMEA
jgi:hypothetical protein